MQDYAPNMEAPTAEANDDEKEEVDLSGKCAEIKEVTKACPVLHVPLKMGLKQPSQEEDFCIKETVRLATAMMRLVPEDYAQIAQTPTAEVNDGAKDKVG